MFDTLSIVDGDFLLWYATMGNKVLNAEGIALKEDGKFIYTSKLEEEVYKCCDEIISLILNKTNSNYYVGYIGACKSFRYEVYPDYKGTRKRDSFPEFYNELRGYLIKEYKFIETKDGLEADDCVNIVKNNFKNDYNCIIVSPDKDLIKLEGTYLNPRNMEIGETSKEEAFEYFWKSMIIGDKIDNIKSLPGKGEVYANKVVELSKEMNTQLPIEVLDRYIRHYSDHSINEGIEEFYKNYKCLYILDKFSNFVIPELIPWEYKLPYFESVQIEERI